MSSVRWPWSVGSVSGVLRLLPVHAAVVAQIHGRSFAHGWDEDVIGTMLLDDMIQADGLFHGAQNSPQNPVGFALSRCVLDEAEILTIAVAERWRGRGASAPLLQHHIQRLAVRGIKTIHLEVEEGNKPALRLYERFGFVQQGERKGYYARADGTRATALLMSCEI